jgi:GTPase SAR1 family protein
MGNYYDETMVTIRALLEEGNLEEAKRMVVVELSMPYVPEPYYSELNDIMSSFRDEKDANLYYYDIDSIYNGLLGDDATKAKAIASLENMNLRTIKDDLVIMLNGEGLDDLSKRYILMLVMDQELNLDIDMRLDGRSLVLNTGDLESPFTNEKVMGIYSSLIDLYEDSNPSFLKFCLEELNLQLLSSFPFVSEVLSLDYIVGRVSSYFES